jgi:hypothetical protein
VSYDLYLFRKDEGDPTAAYERLDELEERDPTPAERERLRRLAADLQAADPDLDVSESADGFCLQLGYENERPVVIDIHGIDGGSITMSWSYGADDAEPALAAVDRYLPVFDRHGYVAYDPQLERTYDPSRDRNDAARVHRDVQEHVFRQLDASADDHRPWWKRLPGVS